MRSSRRWPAAGSASSSSSDPAPAPAKPAPALLGGSVEPTPLPLFEVRGRARRIGRVRHPLAHGRLVVAGTRVLVRLLHVEPLTRGALDPRPRGVGLRRLQRVRIGIDHEHAVEPVVQADRRAVPVVEVDLRRVVDDLLVDGRAQRPVLLVQEVARDRVLGLEHVAGLDDHAVVPFRDHGPERVVVARDDGLAFHGTPFFAASPGNLAGSAVVQTVDTVGRAMTDGAPTTADTRRLAEEARARVRFEEEALGLSDQVYRVARRLAGSREEAEDLVQQTYERAFRSWKQYTPGTNLRAWLLRILTNLNIDKGRRQQRTPQTTSLDNEAGDYYLYNKLESQVPDENPDEERVLEKLSQDSIVDALAEVPHDFRDVIVLVDIGEFSYADAAQILDVPIGTVMSRLHRGRRILKKNLADGVAA